MGFIGSQDTAPHNGPRSAVQYAWNPVRAGRRGGRHQWAADSGRGPGSGADRSRPAGRGRRCAVRFRQGAGGGPGQG